MAAWNCGEITDVNSKDNACHVRLSPCNAGLYNECLLRHPGGPRLAMSTKALCGTDYES
jgi:hypothetical protein